MTPKQKQQIRELRSTKRPMSYMNISLELNIDEGAIAKFCRAEGINKNYNTRPKEGSLMAGRYLKE